MCCVSFRQHLDLTINIFHFNYLLISLCFLSVCISISCISSDPPTFTKPENETLVLSARTKVILNCTAAGNPMPVYSWHFPHKIQQTRKNKNENQPILNTTIDLPGTYNCTAYNARGSMTKYFNVVEAPSKLFFQTS